MLIKGMIHDFYKELGNIYTRSMDNQKVHVEINKGGK